MAPSRWPPLPRSHPPHWQWLPLDERFDESKSRGFNGGLLEGLGPAVAGLLPEVRGAAPAAAAAAAPALENKQVVASACLVS